MNVAMRVVLDTNILISACLKPDGLEAGIVRMVLSGQLQACVTDQVWAEYRDVLFRAKFQAIHDNATTLLNGLHAVALRVIPGDAVSLATDEDDNRLLECAVAGAAQYLITGNLKHFPAECAGTRVLNSRAFLDLYPFLCIN